MALALMIIALALGACERPARARTAAPPARPARMARPQPRLIETDTWDEQRAHVPDAMLAHRISGTAVHVRTGNGVAGVAIALQRYDGMTARVTHALTAADGSFAFADVATGRFSVSVAAPGYLPLNLHTPALPVLLRLEPGATFRLAGLVQDEHGAPVRDATLLLQRVAPEQWMPNIGLRMGACTRVTGADGTFEMANVPVDLCPMYLRVLHPAFPAQMLTNQVVRSSGEDLQMTFILAAGITLSGEVRYASGAPVPSASVWTEPVPPGVLSDAAKHTRTLPPHIVTAGADGTFVTRPVARGERVVVKASSAGFPVAWAGPWDQGAPPPAWIVLEVNDRAGRFAGRCTDAAGCAISTVSAALVWYDTQAYYRETSRDEIALECEEDGSYLSAPVQAGTHDVVFSSPGYASIKRRLHVRDADVALADVVFQELASFTGRVVDASSLQPVAGVTVSVERVATGAPAPVCSPLTDQQGLFWVNGVEGALLVFRHSAYASQYISVNVLDLQPGLLEVRLMPCTHVRLHVYEADGTPANRLIGQLVGPRNGDWRNGAFVWNVLNQWVTDGTLFFSNVPMHSLPLHGTVIGPVWNTPSLGRSEDFTPQPGVITEVRIDLPPMGTLTVATRTPLDRQRAAIRAVRSDPDAAQASKRPFVLQWQGDAWRETRMLPGTYGVTISMHDAALVRTSAVVRAHAETHLMLDVAVKTGVIEGVIFDYDGAPFSAEVALYQAGKEAEGTSRSHHGSTFRFEGLDDSQRYHLQVDQDWQESGAGTTVVMLSVAPNGPPLEIRLPRLYRITGTVVDEAGRPARAFVSVGGRWRALDSGNFTIYPAAPGEHQLTFKSPQYTPVTRVVSVRNADVDVGEIVLRDKGIQVRGRVIGPDGAPVPQAHVMVMWRESADALTDMFSEGRTDDKGLFSIAGVSRNVELHVLVFHRYLSGHTTCAGAASAVDAGTVTLRPRDN